MPAWVLSPRVVSVPAATGAMVSGPGCVSFWAFEDQTASSGSSFALYDGSDTTSQLILPATTLPNESFRDFAPRHVLPFRSGLYFDLISGTIVGTVAVLLGHDCTIGFRDTVDEGW